MHIFIKVVKAIGLFIGLFLGYYTLCFLSILWLLKCFHMVQGGGWAIAFILSICISPLFAITTPLIIKIKSRK